MGAKELKTPSNQSFSYSNLPNALVVSLDPLEKPVVDRRLAMAISQPLRTKLVAWLVRNAGGK